MSRYCSVMNAHLVYPKDNAVSSAVLLLIPARQVKTTFWECDGMFPPYFSLNSSGLSWRAPFTCATADERNQRESQECV